MANHPIHMKQLRQVLRLYVSGHSKRSIATKLQLSRNTIRKYIQHFHDLRLTSDDLHSLTDLELSKLFTRHVTEELNPRLSALRKLFPYMDKELRKVGVTKTLLWHEYLEKHPDGYRFTQFCRYYHRWKKRVDPTIHIHYRAGDKMLVDYAGKKLELIDPDTGEVEKVEVFIATLGSSQYTYIEATRSQKKEDFIGSCERALRFFRGVPKAIVTDNLKSAVTKSDRFEPILNEDFADFADHYQTTILPTRAYRPKDKALVEGMVKIAYRKVYAPLRNTTFHHLEDLNRELSRLTLSLNRSVLSGRDYSREDLYLELDLPALLPLREAPFELKTYVMATVQQNCHVQLSCDKHYYSAPYKHIGKKVKIAYTSQEVRIYHKYELIAIHKRTRSPHNYTTLAEHLPSKHRQMVKWSPEFFIERARKTGKSTLRLVQRILEKKQYPEQAYKSCVGVLSLEKKVGTARLNKACELACEHQRYSYKHVLQILEKGMDQLQASDPSKPLPKHDNIRGGKYFS